MTWRASAQREVGRGERVRAVGIAAAVTARRPMRPSWALMIREKSDRWRDN